MNTYSNTKEKIIERIKNLQEYLDKQNKDDWGYFEPLDHHIENEITFLEEIVNLIGDE